MMSSSRVGWLIRNMSLRSPPELVLRQAIRRDNALGGTEKLCTQATSASEGSFRAAVCTEFGKSLAIQRSPRKPLAREEVFATGLDSGYSRQPPLKTRDFIGQVFFQIRMKVRGVGVNFSDVLMVQGTYQERPTLPFVPGREIAGEVLEVGDGVKNVRVGQRVFGMSMTLGGFAEEAVLNSMMVAPIPQSVDYSSAAALLCSYGTAFLALKHRCNIKNGDVVLVTAAAGGVGLAAVDLATNMFGAKVIGACGTAKKCAFVKQRGAVQTINYSCESIKDRVKDFTNGKGADIILDAVGGNIFDECVRCVAYEGRIAVVGFASGTIPKIPANLLLVKSFSAVGVFWGSSASKNPPAFQESVTEVTKGMMSGQIQPHVSKTFTLDQVNEAFMYLAKRQSTGKVVVTM